MSKVKFLNAKDTLYSPAFVETRKIIEAHKDDGFDFEIIFMSDGLPNPKDKYNDEIEKLKEYEKLITTFATFGAGETDNVVLNNLTKNMNGQFTQVKNFNDLSKHYVEVASNIGAPKPDKMS